MQVKNSNSANILKLAELGLKEDKVGILQFLQGLAVEEMSKKRPGSYNKILNLVEKYVANHPTTSSFTGDEPFDQSSPFDFNTKEIWLPENIESKIEKFISLHDKKNHQLLESNNLNKLILYGPPGSGKTTLGFYIAKRLNKSVSYAKVSDLISPRLGETMKNISDLFQESRSSIIFIDEFDAFAKKRTDSNDVGELKRIVSSIIQTFDFNTSGKIIIVSTNLIEVLDPAILRRFGFKIHIGLLDEKEVGEFVDFLLKEEGRIGLKLSNKDKLFLLKIIYFLGLRTVDEIRLLLDKSVITAILSDKKVVVIDDFVETVFSEDYITHQNVKSLKKNDKETLSLLAKFLKDRKYPKTEISKLLGIHRNSYKNYVKEI